MICHQCGTQNGVNANFCSACGTQLRQQPVNPFLNNPGFQPHDNVTPQEDKIYRSIFTIGIAVFAIDMFWVLYNVVMRSVGYEHYSDIAVFITPLSLISSIILPFICFLFAKKGSQKTVLLVFFIIMCLVQIYQHYLYDLFNKSIENF